MKNLIIASLLTIALVGCGSVPTKPAVTHVQSIGAVQITYDDEGNWTKISSTGTAPLINKTPTAVSESAKIASMRAKQNIAEFMSNGIKSEKTTNTNSTSTVHTAGDKTDGDMTTITTVVEQIRDEGNAVLRGVQTVGQTSTSDFVTVEVAATKQSITAAHSIQTTMGN